MVVVMGSSGNRPGDGGVAQRAGRACRRGAGATVAGRSRRRRWPPRCPRLCVTSPSSTGRRSLLVGEPLFLDVVAVLTESFAAGERRVMPRVVGGRYGLSSKEFTPGMVAGVFAELAEERPRRRFTIGITDDVSDEPRLRRVSDIEPPETVRAIFFGLARTGRSARTRTRSRSSATRACTRKATSSTTRRSPARRRSRTSASGRRRSGRLPRAAGGLRRLPPVRAARPGRRARPRGGRRDAAAQLPAPAGRGVGGAVAPGAGADPPSTSTCTRSTPAGSRARSASPDGQHRPADLLLRPLRGLAARAGDRGSRRRSRRPTAAAAPRWSSATRRRSTARWKVCTGSRCPSG